MPGVVTGMSRQGPPVAARPTTTVAAGMAAAVIVDLDLTCVTLGRPARGHCAMSMRSAVAPRR